MIREPVNPDDLQMTAYALGELNAAEFAEFEARLQDSPHAMRELGAMREVMSLLSEGLRGEWQAEFERPALKLLDPVEILPASREKIVVGSFGTRRQKFAAAAAVAGILLVGSLIIPRQKGGENAPVQIASIGSAVAGGMQGAAPHVPQLFLAEEVGDLSSLDLVGGADVVDPVIDASYLESDSVIPASFQPGSRSVTSDRAPEVDRVDSYLPPVGGFVLGRGATTGMIERRLGRGESHGSSRSSSVLVSGYVTMDGGNSAAGPQYLGGFRPVSISANPVVNEESDLRLLADLNGLQKDLSEVIRELPKEASERGDLERILERSQRVVSQLKKDMTR